MAWAQRTGVVVTTGCASGIGTGSARRSFAHAFEVSSRGYEARRTPSGSRPSPPLSWT